MKKIIAIAASLLMLGSAFAQEISNSAYFLDGYALKHEFNPAFASQRNYIALPAIGGVNTSTRSSLGLSTFVYPTANGLKLFTSSEVNAEEFLSKLNGNNRITAGANVNVLSFGFGAKNGGFLNFGVNLKADAGANLPYDLFDFVKNIGAKETYTITNFGLYANSYAEVYGGYSKNINSNLRIGGKVKLLLGLAAANVNVDELQLQISESQWSATTQASAKFYSAPGTFGIQNNADGNIDMSKIQINPAKPIGGVGAAIDLGAVYEGLIDGLTLSASVKDLGFIAWNNCLTAGNDNGQWVYNGFDNISFDQDAENSIEDQIENLGKDLANLVALKKQGEGKEARMLACKVNVGAEYAMPFYDKLRLGLLYAARFNKQYSIGEARVFATVSPIKWLSFSTSYGIGDCGSMWGLSLSIHTSAFSLFVSKDAMPTSITPKFEMKGIQRFTPVHGFNNNTHIGLIINLGNRK